MKRRTLPPFAYFKGYQGDSTRLCWRRSVRLHLAFFWFSKNRLLPSGGIWRGGWRGWWLCGRKLVITFRSRFHLKAHGLGECALLGVEGQKFFRTQFERSGDVQKFEAAIAAFAGKLQGDLQCPAMDCRPIARHDDQCTAGGVLVQFYNGQQAGWPLLPRQA